MESGPEEPIIESAPPESPPRERNPGGLIYECINCGSKLTADQLAMTPEIKSPFCGYRILQKERPQTEKHVKPRKQDRSSARKANITNLPLSGQTRADKPCSNKSGTSTSYYPRL